MPLILVPLIILCIATGVADPLGDWEGGGGGGGGASLEIVRLIKYNLEWTVNRGRLVWFANTFSL